MKQIKHIEWGEVIQSPPVPIPDELIEHARNFLGSKFRNVCLELVEASPTSPSSYPLPLNSGKIFDFGTVSNVLNPAEQCELVLEKHIPQSCIKDGHYHICGQGLSTNPQNMYGDTFIYCQIQDGQLIVNDSVVVTVPQTNDRRYHNKSVTNTPTPMNLLGAGFTYLWTENNSYFSINVSGYKGTEDSFDFGRILMEAFPNIPGAAMFRTAHCNTLVGGKTNKKFTPKEAYRVAPKFFPHSDDMYICTFSDFREEEPKAHTHSQHFGHYISSKKSTPGIRAYVGLASEYHRANIILED